MNTEQRKHYTRAAGRTPEAKPVKQIEAVPVWKVFVIASSIGIVLALIVQVMLLFRGV